MPKSPSPSAQPTDFDNNLPTAPMALENPVSKSDTSTTEHKNSQAVDNRSDSNDINGDQQEKHVCDSNFQENCHDSCWETPAEDPAESAALKDTAQKEFVEDPVDVYSGEDYNRYTSPAAVASSAGYTRDSEISDVQPAEEPMKPEEPATLFVEHEEEPEEDPFDEGPIDDGFEHVAGMRWYVEKCLKEASKQTFRANLYLLKHNNYSSEELTQITEAYASLHKQLADLTTMSTNLMNGKWYGNKVANKDSSNDRFDHLTSEKDNQKRIEDKQRLFKEVRKEFNDLIPGPKSDLSLPLMALKLEEEIEFDDKSVTHSLNEFSEICSYLKIYGGDSAAVNARHKRNYKQFQKYSGLRKIIEKHEKLGSLEESKLRTLVYEVERQLSIDNPPAKNESKSESKNENVTQKFLNERNIRLVDQRAQSLEIVVEYCLNEMSKMQEFLKTHFGNVAMQTFNTHHKFDNARLDMIRANLVKTLNRKRRIVSLYTNIFKQIQGGGYTYTEE